MSGPSIPRRSVLGASLAATAAFIPAVASSCPAPGPDAVLMDVLARFWLAERAILAMEASTEPPLTDPEYPAWEAKFDALIASRAQAMGQMAGIRSMTPEGRRGKAQVVERCLPSSVRWDDGGMQSPEILLALSLARDVAG
ncbi:hypothetical protein JK169_10460 [Acetobacter persici]|uniref:hypothetical protein n=1 Tax=Acetobacter persici TaxID=1076596 RepID=UPI001BA93219|nr:hypothetical protein [Acetobacter persici]MBS1001423.1 hypothetical protein [Acetobacter persici]